MKNLKFDAEYASEVMNVIPAGYIDKTICGCGLSTVALENNVHTVIAVPSVELIRNKVAQYPNDRSNKILFGVYNDIGVSDINEYVSKTKIVKIMVTYDSLWKVEHLLTFCHLVIDESNKLLSSSSLKSNSKTSSKSVDITTKVFDLSYRYKETVSFISATPTPLEYMPKWISEIPQIKIEWSNTIKAKPILMERTYPYKSLTSEILSPLNEKGNINLCGLTISKVIVFMNSVENIVKVIKESSLQKEDVAIIAANSIENDLKIKGYNRLTNPKQLPKYTFITSSGFEGIDLEDEEAINIVVSNTGKHYQMIDMLTDLKQAISRQRNKQNPNYDKFIYIYNQSIFSKTNEELLQELNDKQSSLEEAIYLWEIAKKDNKRNGFKYTEENKDFITYTNYNPDTESYELNYNLFQADKYFILNIREQYKKGFDLKGEYEDYSVVKAPDAVKSMSYIDMVKLYNETGNIEEYKYKSDYYTLITQSLQLYNKVWANYTYAKQMVENYSNEYVRVQLTITHLFKEGEKYDVKEVKQKLQKVYDDYGINRKAKSTDLQEFMFVKEVKSNGCRFVEVINKNKTIK
jgi:hypothetical protein